MEPTLVLFFMLSCVDISSAVCDFQAVRSMKKERGKLLCMDYFALSGLIAIGCPPATLLSSK